MNDVVDFKGNYGLTNSEIALGIDQLSDEDFYELFSVLAAFQGIDDDETWIDNFSKWLRNSLEELYPNGRVEESE